MILVPSFFVNMIYRPLFLILDPSVAHGDSHELGALMVLSFDGFWEFGFGFEEGVHVIFSDL